MTNVSAVESARSEVSLRELYDYKVQNFVSETELERIQESEEDQLRECTFQPRVNQKGAPTDEVVWDRVKEDIERRNGLKQRFPKQQEEAELAGCTFAPRISNIQTNKMEQVKKTSHKETTKRLVWIRHPT